MRLGRAARKSGNPRRGQVSWMSAPVFFLFRRFLFRWRGKLAVVQAPIFHQGLHALGPLEPPAPGRSPPARGPAWTLESRPNSAPRAPRISAPSGVRTPPGCGSCLRWALPGDRPEPALSLRKGSSFLLPSCLIWVIHATDIISPGRRLRLNPGRDYSRMPTAVLLSWLGQSPGEPAQRGIA